MKEQYLSYQELKLVADSSSGERIKSSLTAKINQIWNEIVRFLTASEEPKIYLLKSKHGDTYWEVYDSISRRRVCFDSESEVRAWLERCHY